MQKKSQILTVMLAVLMLSSISVGLAAGEDLSTSRTTAKSYIPFKFEATGLTESTFYTLYKGTTLLANSSTGAAETTITFTVTFAESDEGTNVQIDLENSTGTLVLDSVYIDITPVISESQINLLAWVVENIIPIMVVLAIAFGLPALFFTAIGMSKR